MSSRKYTHTCYHCHQEKAQHNWTSFGENRYVCSQCVTPLLLKQEALIHKLAAKLASQCEAESPNG
jgi:hypothetical protein